MACPLAVRNSGPAPRPVDIDGSLRTEKRADEHHVKNRTCKFIASELQMVGGATNGDRADKCAGGEW
ncbi:MAG: hypothetical protein OJF61_000355 [Rhodanobacteraceae bacterium]|nr:MAG: hypothetical protein OJF61_000355 [Rhodanobacteraceae bacterium]